MMIDLTLTDSEDEVLDIGAGSQQQKHSPAAAAQHHTAADAAGSDSDDDRPLHQIKAEIAYQRSSQPLDGSPQQQQQGASQQKRPPRKLVSKKAQAAAAAAAAASQDHAAAAQPRPLPTQQQQQQQQQSQHPPDRQAASPSPSPGEKENASPAAATGGEGGGAGAAGGAGVRPLSGRVRQRSSGLQPLNFDDPPMQQTPPDTTQQQQQEGGTLWEDTDELLPLHKRLKADNKQQQQTCAEQGTYLLSDDDDVLLCGETTSAAAAAVAAAAAAAGGGEDGTATRKATRRPPQQKQQQQQRGAPGLEGASSSDLDLDSELRGLGQLGPGDTDWQPPDHMTKSQGRGGNSSGSSEGHGVGGDWAWEAEYGGGGGEGEDAELSDDSYSGGRGKKKGTRGKQQQRRRQPAGASDGGGSSTGAAAAAAAAAAGGGGSVRVRLSAEERVAERAAKAASKAAEREAEKARKAADKIAAKLAKQVEAQAAKESKRMEAFISRKLKGNFGERECVLVMDEAAAASALGLAVAAELERRRKAGWQVVPRLPLSGRWRGCSCFAFKRRKLCEADQHELQTASTARVEVLREDESGRPPYVQLVFEQPGPFLDQLAADSLAGLLAAVRGAHPRATLGVVVLGLRAHVRRVETQGLRAGGGGSGGVSLDWRRVSQQLLALHLTTPGLQLRLLTKQEEAAAHLINTARALGEQPYTVESQLEACAGGGPGAASKAAAGAMAAQLGPVTSAFAVNTLGKMHGMGGHKAWAIAQSYPSFGALISAFERAKTSGGAPAQLLSDLTEPEGSGKAKPRRVGPAMSSRLHRLLTSEDPDEVVEAAGEGGD